MGHAQQIRRLERFHSGSENGPGDSADTPRVEKRRPPFGGPGILVIVQATEERPVFRESCLVRRQVHRGRVGPHVRVVGLDLRLRLEGRAGIDLDAPPHPGGRSVPRRGRGRDRSGCLVERGNGEPDGSAAAEVEDLRELLHRQLPMARGRRPLGVLPTHSHFPFVVGLVALHTQELIGNADLGGPLVPVGGRPGLPVCTAVLVPGVIVADPNTGDGHPERGGHFAVAPNGHDYAFLVTRGGVPGLGEGARPGVGYLRRHVERGSVVCELNRGARGRTGGRGRALRPSRPGGVPSRLGRATVDPDGAVVYPGPGPRLRRRTLHVGPGALSGLRFVSGRFGPWGREHFHLGRRVRLGRLGHGLRRFGLGHVRLGRLDLGALGHTGWARLRPDRSRSGLNDARGGSALTGGRRFNVRVGRFRRSTASRGRTQPNLIGGHPGVRVPHLFDLGEERAGFGPGHEITDPDLEETAGLDDIHAVPGSHLDADLVPKLRRACLGILRAHLDPVPRRSVLSTGGPHREEQAEQSPGQRTTPERASCPNAPQLTHYCLTKARRSFRFHLGCCYLWILGMEDWALEETGLSGEATSNANPRSRQAAAATSPEGAPPLRECARSHRSDRALTRPDSVPGVRPPCRGTG